MDELDSLLKQHITISDIRVEDDPLLLDLLETHVAPGASRNGRVLTSAVGDVDLSKAVKVENPNLNTVRYTLLIADESGAPEFQNYIIKVRNDTVTQYVIEYEPHYSWISSDRQFFNYTGRVTAHTLDGVIIAENSFIDGERIDSSTGRTETCFDCTITTETSSTTGRDYTVIECEDGSVFHTYSRTECDDSGSSNSDSDSGGSDTDSSHNNTGGTTSGGSTSGGSSGTPDSNTSSTGNPDDPLVYDENYDPIGVLSEMNPRVALEIIIEREQDPETRRKIQLSYIHDFGGEDGKAFKNMAEELVKIRGINVGFVSDVNELVDRTYYELKAQYILAIFSPEIVGEILFLSIYADVTGSVRNKLFKTIARYTKEAAGKGYRTFSAFKRAQGAAGKNKSWHHIVNQKAQNIERFGAKAIHNTKNLVKVDDAWHARINSFYLRINPNGINTNGMRFGNWVAQKSFQEQMEWGLKVMRWTKGG